MTIGERIRARREQIGMTQEDLALALGYKSKSSVNKIEVGRQELTQKKILKTAEVLHTTVSYIMGWDDAQEQLESVGADVQYVADELGVPLQSLLGLADSNDPKTVSVVVKAATMIAESIRERREQMALKDLQFALWGDSEDMDEEDLKAVLDYAEYIKMKKNNKNR